MHGSVAFFESGDLLRNLVLGDLKILWPQTADVISLAIRDGNVELHQNYGYAQMCCVVLSGEPRFTGDEKQHAQDKSQST